jgi:hypothetical protein
MARFRLRRAERVGSLEGSRFQEGQVRGMILVTAGTLAIGATAGMMLEQRFGDTVVQWCRRQLARRLRPRR